MHKFITVLTLTILFAVYFDFDVKAKSYVYTQNFSKDYNMSNNLSEINETFYIEDWNINSSNLELNFSTTDIAKSIGYSVSLNGTKFYSSDKSTDSQIIKSNIDIPVRLFRYGINTITINIYIDSKVSPCSESIYVVDWMNIFKDTKIEIRYTPILKYNSISDFYRQFVSINSNDYSQSMVAIPNDSSQELEWAMNILNFASKDCKSNYQNIDFKVSKSIQDLKQSTIYISKYSDLPDYIFKNMTYSQKQIAADTAIILLLKLKDNKNILLLTAQDEFYLNKAVEILSNSDIVYQLNSIQKEILSDEITDTVDNFEFQYIRISENGNYIKGTSNPSINYFIEYPKNCILADSSQLYLEMRYSNNLDFDNSMVSVYLNDIPIGSHRLSEKNSNLDSIIFEIPINLKISGNFNLKIDFDLAVYNKFCDINKTEIPWAFVTDNSILKLNSIDSPFLLFEYYPSPFVKDYHLDTLAIVVSDNLNEHDYKTISEIVLYIGRYVKSNIQYLKVFRSSELKNPENFNIIAIGDFKSNPFIQKLNEFLFFKFDSTGQYIVSNEKKAIEKSWGAQLGTVQLINSPFSNTKSIAVISGTNSKNVLNASRYISDISFNLYGDGYIADNQNIFMHKFKSDNKKEFTFETDNSHKDLILLSSISITIIILIFISGIFVFLKYKRRFHIEK